MKQYKWGILSTGTIAAKFADTLANMGDEAQLYAVASRSMETAKAFAERHGAAKAYDSYEALAKDPEVDLIYIATPHSLHYENMVLCLQNGKHVLCEKSFTVTAAQAEKAYALAAQNHLL
jgi:predicted dehydrogenase